MNLPDLPCFLTRAECPPAIRVVIAGDLHRPSEQLTVWRGNDEPDAAFYARVQAAGQAQVRLHSFKRWVYLECDYAPSDEMPDGRPYDLVLGGGQAIAGVEELVMELSPGETKERSVKWPDDFPDEAQRGIAKNVRVTTRFRSQPWETKRTPN